MNSDPQTLLTAAQCYVCIGVSLPQALELALLASIASDSLQPAPVLSSNPDLQDLEWTYTGTDPSLWQIQQSVDGVNWSNLSTQAGSTRSTGAVANAMSYRIFGIDGNNKATTLTSNTVFVL